jgi:hypothetical protein
MLLLLIEQGDPCRFGSFVAVTIAPLGALAMAA